MVGGAVPRKTVCSSCGQEHGSRACPNAKSVRDIELQEVYSGRRNAVNLSGEETGPSAGFAAPSSVATSTRQPQSAKGAGESQASGARTGAINIEELDAESLMSHSDPFVSALATRLTKSGRLLETMRQAAQTAIQWTRERDAQLQTREERIRSAAEAMRAKRAEIERREAALEEKLRVLESGLTKLEEARREFESRAIRDRESIDRRLAQVEERERALAAKEEEVESVTQELTTARLELDIECREKDIELHAREERLSGLEREMSVRRLEFEAHMHRTAAGAGPAFSDDHIPPPVAGTTGPEADALGLIAASVGVGHPTHYDLQDANAFAEVDEVRVKLAQENQRLSLWGKEIRKKEQQLDGNVRELAAREEKLLEMERRLRTLATERESLER